MRNVEAGLDNALRKWTDTGNDPKAADWLAREFVEELSKALGLNVGPSD